MEYMHQSLRRCFGADRDDFWGITGESDDEPMLSHNQLKVSGSFVETMTEA